MRLRAQAVSAEGRKWSLVARHVPSRSDVQCRERFVNVLDPALRPDPWDSGNFSLTAPAFATGEHIHPSSCILLMLQRLAPQPTNCVPMTHCSICRGGGKASSGCGAPHGQRWHHQLGGRCRRHARPHRQPGHAPLEDTAEGQQVRCNSMARMSTSSASRM